MPSVEIALKEYLDAHDLSAYRLVQATKGRVAERTVYSLARAETKRVDLGVLGEVLNALGKLTGEDVTPNDVLRFVDLPEDDTAAMLEAGAVDLGHQLAALEKDTPKDELEAWLNSFEAHA